MIPLALIEGKIVFVAIALIVGAINAWLEKKKKDSVAGLSQKPPAQRAPTPRISESESEQERLNRFLQALGVPQQPAKPQPVQRNAPPPAKIQPAVIRPRDRQQPAKQRASKPVQKVTRLAPPMMQVAEEMPRAGRIEEPATSIERISGEFNTMNVRVEMPPVTSVGRATNIVSKSAGTTALVERSGNPLVASLRRTLTNPTDIRAAFLAAELLGPPRGLRAL